MKESERNIHKREKLPKEFYISGAVSVTVTIGALVGLLIHSTKAAEREYLNENLGFSLRVEKLIEDNPDRFHWQILDKPDQIQAEHENEFKTRNRLLEKSQLEQFKVMETVENNPQVFSEQDAVDVEMYYPIYKAAGVKFNVDWYLLWIMHQEESTVSRDPNAFNGSDGYVGAMQRDPYFYPEEIVDGASEGLEHLTKLPQRHATDWREIAFAGWKINRDRQNAQNRGANEPLLSALFAYSAQGPALSRWDKFNYFSNIFNES